MKLGGSKSLYDFLFVYVAYTLRYVYLLILIPYYGRVLGTDGYGIVLSAMSIMNLAWIITGWGFSAAGVRAIAVAKESEYGTLFAQHFSARVLLSLVAVVVALVSICFSSILSGNLLTSAFALALGVLSAFNLGWYLTGSNRSRSAVKLEVLGFILSLGLILLLVKTPQDAHLALLSLLLSSIAVTAVAHGSIFSELPRKNLFQPAQGLELIRSSGYLFLYASSAMFISAASTYILGLASTPALVGAYGAADRLVSLGLGVMAPIGVIFIPKVTAQFAKNPLAAYRLTRKIFLLLLGISLTGALLCLTSSPFIIRLIFGHSFDSAIPLLTAFAPVFPINALIIGFSAYVFIPNHSEKPLAYAVFTGVAINIAVAIYASRVWGGVGVIHARLLGDSITLLLLVLTAWRKGFLLNLIPVKK
jgi:O-antigen/teichoic acid export membrane protein